MQMPEYFTCMLDHQNYKLLILSLSPKGALSWPGETKRSQNQKSWKKEEIIPPVTELWSEGHHSHAGALPPHVQGCGSLQSYECQDLFLSLPAQYVPMLHPREGQGLEKSN